MRLEPFDGLAIQGLGGRAVAEQRACPGANAERPVRAGSAGAFLEPSQGSGGFVVIAASGARLDQLEQGEAVDAQVVVRAGCRAAASAAS